MLANEVQDAWCSARVVRDSGTILQPNGSASEKLGRPPVVAVKGPFSSVEPHTASQANFRASSRRGSARLA